MVKLEFRETLDAEKIKDWVEVDDIVDWYGLDIIYESGEWLRGRCPFHEDQHPSFGFNRDEKFYHCFVCGSGDVITFIQEMEEVDFHEALRILRDRFTPLGTDSARTLEVIKERLDNVSVNKERKGRQSTLALWREIRIECSIILQEVYEAGKEKCSMWEGLARVCYTTKDRDEAMSCMIDFAGFERAWERVERRFEDKSEELDRTIGSAIDHNEKVLTVFDVYDWLYGKINELKICIEP